MSEEQAKYSSRSEEELKGHRGIYHQRNNAQNTENMKLNYEWCDLQQHKEDKDYFWTELCTPFGCFSINTSYTKYMKGTPGMYDVRHRGVIKKEVKTIEEGKEWVNSYLIKQTKLVIDSIE